MQYLLAFIFPLISFFIQVYPRFYNKHFGVDVWTRLLEIENVKRAKHKIPGEIKKGFIITGKFDYPIIFPWIFSFFSKKTLLSLQGFVSPFFDVLQNFFIFFIALYFTGNIYIALLSQAMYTVIPIIPIENSYLTPRSMGYVVFTLAFFPIFSFQTNHNIILILISFFFTCVLFLTHRFAIQSFVFISIFFSVVDWTLIYLANLTLSFLTVIILSRGYYLRVLRGHLYNIYFWVINYKYRFAHQIYGLKSKKRTDWVSKIYSLLSIFSPIMMFAMNVWAFSAVIYFFLYFQILPNFLKGDIYFRMSLWIIFFYIFGSIVLKIKRLTPIGEGQRYMEMSTVPSVILSSVICFNFYLKYPFFTLFSFVILILGNLGLILFIQIKAIITDKNRSLTSDLQKTYKYINQSTTRPRILCIPHQITTMTVYNTKADVLVNADNAGLMRIQEIYPLLKVSISALQKKYNLDYLLLRESYVKLSDLKISKPRIIFRSGDVALINIRKPT